MKILDLDLRGPDAGRYAKFLDDQGEGLFQSPAWATVKEDEGWRAWPLVAVSGAEIRAGLIALEKRIAPGLGGIWYVPRGPVAALATPEGREAAARLLDALALRARARGGVSIRVSPDVPEGTLPSGWIERLGYTRASITPWLHGATFRVDLARPEEAILAAMESRTRAAIRKAGAAGVTIDSTNTKVGFAIFHRMLGATAERNAFPLVAEKRMRALWERSGAEDWGRVFLSRGPDGDPLTGAFVLAPGRRCHYLFGASLPACRKIHPNELLHWEVMRWARARGCTVYDLQGVAGRIGPGHPLWGNYLFKRGFGGAYVALEGEFVKVLRPQLDRAITWGLTRLRGVRRARAKGEENGGEDGAARGA
jgi:lipid II:glycine glycyltransferase (peptidoglycan interpeptide bridge formation enzyme)